LLFYYSILEFLTCVLFEYILTCRCESYLRRCHRILSHSIFAPGRHVRFLHRVVREKITKKNGKDRVMSCGRILLSDFRTLLSIFTGSAGSHGGCIRRRIFKGRSRRFFVNIARRNFVVGRFVARPLGIFGFP